MESISKYQQYTLQMEAFTVTFLDSRLVSGGFALRFPARNSEM